MKMSMARTLTLVVVECPACGVEYGIPDHLNGQLLEKAEKGTAYCPNGHNWSYRGKSLEDQLRTAEAKAVHARDQLRAAELALAGKENEIARARRRSASGVCPVPGCKRSGFTRLATHITAKHPDYVE